MRDDDIRRQDQEHRRRTSARVLRFRTAGEMELEDERERALAKLEEYAKGVRWMNGD